MSELKRLIKSELEAEIKKEQLKIDRLNDIIRYKAKDKTTKERKELELVEERNNWRKEMLEKYK